MGVDNEVKLTPFKLDMELSKEMSQMMKVLLVNSLTTKKQTTKFSSANFRKMLSLRYIILRIQRLEGKQRRSR